jgi:hypothetical protein
MKTYEVAPAGFVIHEVAAVREAILGGNAACEHKSRFSYARGAIHSDGRSGVRELASRTK